MGRAIRWAIASLAMGSGVVFESTCREGRGFDRELRAEYQPGQVLESVSGADLIRCELELKFLFQSLSTGLDGTRSKGRNACMVTSDLERILSSLVDQTANLEGGAVASYIPELAQANPDACCAAITLPDGSCVLAGNGLECRFTLQSSAKLILLAALLEERGEEEVFRRVGMEPSGSSFASISRLDTHGPIPANPLLNSGAIALSDMLEGDRGERVAWIRGWASALCDLDIEVNQEVFESECRTGDRNRSLAYLLRQNGVIQGEVDAVLDAYFSLCSLEGNARCASHLAAVLAHGGLAPSGERLLSRRTASCVVSLMATCGMYDESGTHLLETGLPSKSGVSGIIVAVAPRRAGIAVWSPRINAKGGSVRGHAILRSLSQELGLHFALPNQP
jgi:glutaminase